MVYPSYFATSDLQFGFKKQLSTTLCTGLIKKVVSKFVHAGSHVCGCFLDAMIAFDRVNHQADSERHFPLPLNRFLVSWYRSQKMQIRWNDSLATPFSVTNGIGQEGVLSPILFTVYLNNLLTSLGSVAIEMISLLVQYATRMTFPSPFALLKHCEEFAISRGLTFNAMQ